MKEEAMPATKPVLTETHGNVLVVTINRAHARNAVDGVTAQLLFEAFSAFDADDGLRVAILTGVDGTFCSGADLKAVATKQGNRMEHREPAEIVGSSGPMGPSRMDLSKPVIAAVEGFAVAGGLELALWCDMRVAASDATFGVYCRRWGVPLVDGGTVRLPRIVGHGNAMDLILTGRPVQGDEAMRMGLVQRLSEPGQALTDALALAAQIAAFPQTCARSDRRSAIDQWSLDLGSALSNEITLGLAVLASGETLEGANRFASGEGRHGQF